MKVTYFDNCERGRTFHSNILDRSNISKYDCKATFYSFQKWSLIFSLWFSNKTKNISVVFLSSLWKVNGKNRLRYVLNYCVYSTDIFSYCPIPCWHFRRQFYLDVSAVDIAFFLSFESNNQRWTFVDGCVHSTTFKKINNIVKVWNR